MDVTITLNEVLKLALKLSPKDRLQLIERVASSVEKEIEAPATTEPVSEEEHWGRNLVNLIKSLDMSEWETMEIDDVVEWVRELRRSEEDRLKAYWDGEK